MEQTYTRATDHVSLSSDLTPMENLEQVELLLHGIKPMQTRFGAGLALTLEDPDTHTLYTVCTSGVVIMPALIELQAKVDLGEASFPVLVRFIRPGKAWLME